MIIFNLELKYLKEINKNYPDWNILFDGTLMVIMVLLVNIMKILL